MKNYSDFEPEQQEQIENESGYSREQLKTEDPLLIPENQIEDFLVDEFCEAYEVGSEQQIRFYLDEEKIVRDMKMDYTLIEIDNDEYWFRAW